MSVVGRPTSDRHPPFEQFFSPGSAIVKGLGPAPPTHVAYVDGNLRNESWCPVQAYQPSVLIARSELVDLYRGALPPPPAQVQLTPVRQRPSEVVEDHRIGLRRSSRINPVLYGVI